MLLKLIFTFTASSFSVVAAAAAALEVSSSDAPPPPAPAPEPLPRIYSKTNCAVLNAIVDSELQPPEIHCEGELHVAVGVQFQPRLMPIDVAATIVAVLVLFCFFVCFFARFGEGACLVVWAVRWGLWHRH
jgi:hypothetical protein